MNQRQSCLSDYSRNFAEFWPLAMARALYMLLLFFCHADFADDADFSSWDYFVPQISQIYTDFFHRKVFHRISRMNQKAFLLIGLLTDFRRILAAGQWLTPYICCCCFWSRRFRRWRRFFFVGGFCPTDFTDLHRFFFVGLFLSHRFHRFTQIFLNLW